MLEELFRIGPLPIRSYGLMMAPGFLFGVWYIKKAADRQGKPFDPYLAISYVLIIGGVVGARLFYVFTHVSEFQGNWMAVINPFQGDQFGIAGLTLYGGILTAAAGAFIYCRIMKLSVLEIFDTFAPPLGLGIAFGRTGCFLNGCCFGTPTDLPWGVTFPAGSIPAYFYGTAPIHPAQLYSVAYALLLFVGLHFLLKHRRFSGQVVAVLFMGEAFFRFLIEYVRHYDTEMIIELGPISLINNQLVSIGLFVLGAAIYLIQKKDGQTTEAA